MADISIAIAFGETRRSVREVLGFTAAAVAVARDSARGTADRVLFVAEGAVAVAGGGVPGAAAFRAPLQGAALRAGGGNGQAVAYAVGAPHLVVLDLDGAPRLVDVGVPLQCQSGIALQ